MKKALSGWNFKAWFLGNWSTVKEVIKVGVPLAVGLMSTKNPVLAGAITIVGKFLLDLGHYMFKELTK